LQSWNSAISIKRPEMLDEFTRGCIELLAKPGVQQEPRKNRRETLNGRATPRFKSVKNHGRRMRNIRSAAALNSVMSPGKLAGGREGRARAYVVMADRLQFHLEAGTLPPEAAEQVRHAHDALMKASAVLRRAEKPPSSLDPNTGTEEQTAR
jgi:hypothetical protein